MESATNRLWLNGGLAMVLFACSTVASAQNLLLDGVPPIPLRQSDGTSAVAVDPTTGDVTVRSALGNLTACTSGGGPAEITSFVITPATVATGGAFQIAWSATNTNAGATPCVASNGAGTAWAGPRAASGSVNLTAPSAAQALTFTLTCNGPGGADVESRNLTVTSQTCPPGGNLNQTSFQGYFGGAFPAVNPRRVSLSNGNVEVFEFVATSASWQSGSLRTVRDPDGDTGLIRMSISRDPGCFVPASLGDNCMVDYTAFPAVAWQIGGSSSSACVMTPGATYFLNLQPDQSCGTCLRQFQSQSVAPE